MKKLILIMLLSSSISAFADARVVSDKSDIPTLLVYSESMEECETELELLETKIRNVFEDVEKEMCVSYAARGNEDTFFGRTWNAIIQPGYVGKVIFY